MCASGQRTSRRFPRSRICNVVSWRRPWSFTVAFSSKTLAILSSAWRLHEFKGFDLLIRAFAELKPAVPNAFLAIAGWGTHEKQFQNLARELGLEDSARFLGRIPADEQRQHVMVMALDIDLNSRNRREVADATQKVVEAALGKIWEVK